MNRIGVTDIISADKDFDKIHLIKRLDPKTIGETYETSK